MGPENVDHEYGHAVQSRRLGPAYLPLVGVPSVMRVAYAMGCAAALATIELMQEPGFMENVVARGAQLTAGIAELQQEHPTILQVRGPGLMVGTELDLSLIHISEPTRPY